MAVAVGVRRRRARGGSGRLLAAAGLAAGLSVVGTASPLGDFLERELGQVVVLRLRGPVEPPPGVAVVAQDYASAEALGLPAKLGGWPRGLLARAIRNATAAGAGAIALDLVLDTARDPEGDADLAAALRESGRVVLFESMRQEARPVGPLGMTLVRERAIPPLPAFAAVAGSTAPFPLPRDGSRVTGFWAFKPGAEGRPTLPTAAVLAAALAEPGGRQALAAAAERAGLTAAARLLGDASVPDVALAGALRQALLAEPAAPERLATGPAVLRLLAGPDSYPLTPYGPAGTILHVSYHQVVNGDPDALALLRGRILFLGASDPGERVTFDTFPTAFGRPDGVDPAGVEIAATACLNLLSGDLAQTLPAPATAALVAGTAAIAAIVGTALAPPLAGAAVALEGGALTVAALRLLGSHLLLPAGSLLALALPLGLLTGLLARYGIARRQLDRVTGFLTRGRVRRADPLDPLAAAEPHRTRWAVALATDLAGYVRLTEGMRAREPDLAALLTDYRGLLHAIIERHGGTVLDFAGDASMCVWDAERPSGDLRRRAVQAALDLVRELDQFAAARGLDGHPTRVGLAEGEIVLGNLAGGPNFTYGAVGEPLNVAARLEQLNKQHGTRIMATGSLVRGRDDLAVRPLGELVLRGRAVSEEVVAIEAATANG